MTVTAPAGLVAGKSGVFTVAVASKGNGGGTATVTINGKAYTVTIPSGPSANLNETATITVPTPAAGTFNIGAATDAFVPNLQGVNGSAETASTYTVAKTTATVTGSSLRYSHLSTGGYTYVKVAAPGVTATGTVTVVLKTTTGATKYSFAAKTLGAGGTLKFAFGKALLKGTYVVWVSYSGNANINAKSLTKTAGVITVI
jgi:hypothetical protein